jgi:hypothetical protein
LTSMLQKFLPRGKTTTMQSQKFQQKNLRPT